jgi:hypothetical protein
MYNEADGRSRLSFEGASHSDLLRRVSIHQLRNNTTINLCIRTEDWKFIRDRDGGEISRLRELLGASTWRAEKSFSLCLAS